MPEVIAVEENYCRNCAHFQQHYTFDKRRIFRVYCGHCTFGRAKKKLPDAKGCVNFTYANCDENAFVTKEYLSKELLQYLLNLELLPEIQDIDGSEKQLRRSSR